MISQDWSRVFQLETKACWALFRQFNWCRSIYGIQKLLFNFQVSFATSLAADFGCNQFRTVPESFLIFCAFASEVTCCSFSILIGSLSWTEFNFESVHLFPCLIFTQRLMNDGKIEQRYKCCFGLWQFHVRNLSNSRKNPKHCWAKYWCFIWAKRSTARCSVMVHSALIIGLLLASFNVALHSEREKPSWIDWTIEISLSPSTRWVLLCQFPTHVTFSSEPLRNLLCATILDVIYAYLLSDTSARALPPPHHVRDPARAAAGPSTFWWHTSQWVSLRTACWSY